MDILVGFTGFVGSNIYANGRFDAVFNSQNISEAFGTNPDLLIFAGIRAEKFLANKNSQADYQIIEEAFNNIKKINPSRLVLISTIDVYKSPENVNESVDIATNGLQPYGLNRYLLEKMVRKEYPDALIIRLPGLFGRNLKKNFIYDLINLIPSMLSEQKYAELCHLSEIIKDSYVSNENGFYKCIVIDDEQKKNLKQEFIRVKFSALNFTDSRGKFQFYNLSYLYSHINIALQNNIKLLNLATEPIVVNDIYKSVHKQNFVNELQGPIPDYNFKTQHADVFGGKNGYVFTKEKVLYDICSYINEELKEKI